MVTIYESSSVYYNEKLNKHEVIFIREAYKLGIKRKTLANHFNVTRYAINDIATGRSWKNIA